MLIENIYSEMPELSALTVSQQVAFAGRSFTGVYLLDVFEQANDEFAFTDRCLLQHLYAYVL